MSPASKTREDVAIDGLSSRCAALECDLVALSPGYIHLVGAAEVEKAHHCANMPNAFAGCHSKLRCRVESY